VAKRKRLTEKQKRAGFGGKRVMHAKRAHASTKRKAASHKTSTGKKTTKKKSKAVTGVIAHNAVVNDLIIGAGGAALGYTAATLQQDFGTKGLASIVAGGVSAMKNAINYLTGQSNSAPVTPITSSTATSTANLNPNTAAYTPGSSTAILSPGNQQASGMITPPATINPLMQEDSDAWDIPNPLPAGITQDEADALLLVPGTEDQVINAPNNPGNTIFDFVPGPGFNTNLATNPPGSYTGQY